MSKSQNIKNKIEYKNELPEQHIMKLLSKKKTRWVNSEFEIMKKMAKLTNKYSRDKKGSQRK